MSAAHALARPPVPVGALMLLERSRAGLLQACAARSPASATSPPTWPRCGRRPRCSPSGAAPTGPRRTAQRLGRAAPGRPGARRSGRRSSPPPRPAGPRSRPAGATSITARDADDLLRDAETFHHVVRVLARPAVPAGPAAAPCRVAESGRMRDHAVHPPARGLRVLAALRRLDPGELVAAAAAEHGHGRPRADRPGRRLRRGEVRPRLRGRPGWPRCSGWTSPSSRAGC